MNIAPLGQCILQKVMVNSVKSNAHSFLKLMGQSRCSW